MPRNSHYESFDICKAIHEILCRAKRSDIDPTLLLALAQESKRRYAQALLDVSVPAQMSPDLQRDLEDASVDDKPIRCDVWKLRSEYVADTFPFDETDDFVYELLELAALIPEADFTAIHALLESQRVADFIAIAQIARDATVGETVAIIGQLRSVHEHQMALKAAMVRGGALEDAAWKAVAHIDAVQEMHRHTYGGVSIEERAARPGDAPSD